MTDPFISRMGSFHVDPFLKEKVMTDAVQTDRVRHPEKVNRPDNPIKRKPAWIRVKAPVSKQYQETRNLMRGLNLTTVCEEASCPNIGECWSKKHAT